MLAVTVVIGVGCFLLGYIFGTNQIITYRGDAVQMSRQLEAANNKAMELDARLIDAQLNLTVLREASNSLREDLTQEIRKSARLEEEVTFFKGLMSPSSLTKGLQVAELEVVALPEAGTYNFQLLLTQVALRRGFIAGEVRMDVIGRYADDAAADEAVLSLTELTALDAYPLKFRFRYFQDMQGNLTLPDGFSPARILVTANQSGKEPLQVSFPWPELDRPDTKASDL
ncbi:MAG: DUF6776 family protein [bacterium]